MTDEELGKALSSTDLLPQTVNTITDIERLKQELELVKTEDVAADNEEMEIGVKCIASPVRNSEGSIIAAISVSGPTARLSNKRVTEIKTLVKSCAAEVSRALGYNAE